MPLFSVMTTVSVGNGPSPLSYSFRGDGLHLADDANDVVAFGFYNVGNSNPDLTSWGEMKRDLKWISSQPSHIQVVFKLFSSANLVKCVLLRGEGFTEECVENMLLVFGLDYLNGLAMPPYAAIVYPRY